MIHTEIDTCIHIDTDIDTYIQIAEFYIEIIGPNLLGSAF